MTKDERGPSRFITVARTIVHVSKTVLVTAVLHFQVALLAHHRVAMLALPSPFSLRAARLPLHCTLAGSG